MYISIPVHLGTKAIKKVRFAAAMHAHTHAFLPT